MALGGYKAPRGCAARILPVAPLGGDFSQAAAALQLSAFSLNFSILVDRHFFQIGRGALSGLGEFNVGVKEYN